MAKITAESLHELAGTFYDYDGICILAQTDEQIYQMIDVESGNRCDGVKLDAYEMKIFKKYLKDNNITKICGNLNLRNYLLLYGK